METRVNLIKTLRSKPCAQALPGSGILHQVHEKMAICLMQLQVQLPYLHSCSACFMVRHGSSSGYMAGLAKKRREEAEAARREARRKQVNVLRSYRTGKGGGKGRGGVQ